MTRRIIATYLAVLALTLTTSAASLLAQAPRKSPVTPEDYGKWETLGAGNLSPEGEWLAVAIRRVNEENELRIHDTRSDSVVVVAYGSRPVFSPDGGWVAYAIGKSPEETEALEEKDEPVRNDVGLLDLHTGEQSTVDAIEAFSFDGSGRYLVLQRYAGNEEKGTSGIVVRDLESGTDVSFGTVAEHAWQDEGSLLAFTVHAEDDVGNAIQLYDAGEGTLRTLDAEPTKYAHLTWREESDDLAVLRAFTAEARADTSHVVLVWKGLETDGQALMLDPSEHDAIDDDTRIVSYRSLTWGDDGSTLFFGVKEWEAKEEDEEDHPEPEASDEEEGDLEGEGDEGDEEEGEDDGEDEDPTADAEVEIWNSADRRVMPEQKRDATRDEQRNDLAVWHVDDGRALILTDETLEEATVRAGGRVVTAVDTDPYAVRSMFGRNAEDVYAIDIDTGERTLAAEAVSFSWRVSPEGGQVLFYKDGAYRVTELSSGESRVISAGAEAQFTNVDYDHPVPERPPFGSAGWTSGDRGVLVYDKYDVWLLGLDGSAEKLTDGATDQIVFRHVDLDRDNEAIDLDAGVYLSVRGEWTLNHGYARFHGGNVEELVYLDDNVGRLAKAESANVFAYVAQDFDDPPDYFVTNASFRSPRQVTAVNPFHDDHAWGRTELVQYDNHNGRRLHGALFYPANYDPSESYPMITYIYEIRSQSAKQYSVPSERSYYNWAVWTAQGYFVWQPDIVFDSRDPGVSSARTLEASVRAVVDHGVGVDPERVGLVGHSWGGYQAAFVVTNTDVFAAAVAGAPLTDLVSMYGSIFWVASVPESGHFEVGQERMDVPYWEDLDAYVRNSAVFNIETLNTPLLVEVGDADRNVDWRQGLEYYNAARRAGKPLVLVAYHDEGHGLRKEPNQIDYHRRILTWFGHHLKGEEAPDWVKGSVPYLEQKKGNEQHR